MATTATTDTRTSSDAHLTSDTTPATIEDILLGTAADLPVRRGLPELPDGWQHSAVVRRVAATPAERREGLLALGFGLLALLWAPLGLLAVIAGTERVFLGLSLVAAAALVAPRPTGVSRALAGLGASLRPALARARDAVRTTTSRLGDDAAPVVARLRTGLRRALAAGRDRVATFVSDFRDARDRAGDVSAPSGLSDPLSRWVEGQSTPSSRR